MSAEDTTTAPEVVPTVADTTSAAENGTSAEAPTSSATNGEATGDKKSNNKRNNNRNNNNKDDDKPEVPIEELFDFTKPIPRVCTKLNYFSCFIIPVSYLQSKHQLTYTVFLFY
jgi:hypothetical protein